MGNDLLEQGVSALQIRVGPSTITDDRLSDDFSHLAAPKVTEILTQGSTIEGWIGRALVSIPYPAGKCLQRSTAVAPGGGASCFNPLPSGEVSATP